MRLFRTLLCITSLCSFGLLALGGCRTTEGFGRDLERGGEKIADEAREHR